MQITSVIASKMVRNIIVARKAVDMPRLDFITGAKEFPSEDPVGMRLNMVVNFSDKFFLFRPAFQQLSRMSHLWTKILDIAFVPGSFIPVGAGSMPLVVKIFFHLAISAR